MSARPSGAPWLLIEICVLVAAYGCAGGVFHGPLSANLGSRDGDARMAAQRDRAWAGIDVGKRHHWVCAVDADGTRLLSVKIANDEAEICTLVATVGELARQVTWAVDIVGAAVGSAGRSRPAGAVCLWAGGGGDEQCLCRRRQDRLQGRLRDRRDRSHPPRLAH